MKVVVAAFNQEKALVGAFTVIVKTDCETDGSSKALLSAAADTELSSKLTRENKNEHIEQK